MSSETKNNLNTILLTVVLGVLSWMAYTTQQLSVAVGEIRRDYAAAVRQDDDQQREIVELRARITAVEIEFAKLKSSR